MTQFADIEARCRASGFEVPSAYRQLYEAGRLSLGPLGANHWRTHWVEICLSTPPALVLAPWHYGVEWLPADAIAGWSQPETWIAEPFVAFAGDGYGNDWCWAPARSEGEGTPVILAMNDGWESEVFAPDFSSFLFRATLEGLAGMPSRYVDEFGGEEQFRRFLSLSVETLKPVLPAAWTALLAENVTKPLRLVTEDEEDLVGLLDSAEVEQILKLHLPSGTFGEMFTIADEGQ